MARAWLIGVGIQHVVVHAGRFVYRGGTFAVILPVGRTALRPVVESIPGLRGFVGVDFLWDAGKRQATVLEINPRPTTSCVGLTRLLPPGRLAEAWLAAFDRESEGRRVAEQPGGTGSSPIADVLRRLGWHGLLAESSDDRLYDSDRTSWIGLDIGGANIKAAHGAGMARTVPFEVWKRPDELAQAIGSIAATLPAERLRRGHDDGRAVRLLPDQGRGRQRDPRRRRSMPCPSNRSWSGAWTASSMSCRKPGRIPRWSPRPTGWPWRCSPRGCCPRNRRS